ncbi:hypothetical protein EB001_12065 [bacterium]|nr:hypothetical protein [bacterium]
MSLLPSGAIETGGYNINNSLRFRSSASAYLNRTPASAGNRQIMTYSFWVKRGALTADYNLTNATTDASNSATLYFNSSNNQTFDVFLKVGGTNYSLTTSQVFRDPSAWYHIVVAIDTTQATSSNRTKVYVNGSQVTNFLTANYVPQNSNLALNNNVAQYIGYSSYFDGYMTEINFIDGQALTPSSFGQTDAVTGSWVAKKYTGTYGTNGFYLPFTNYSTSGGVFSSYYGNFNSTGTTSTSTLLRINDNAVFNSGSSDFCWELFFYPTTSTSGSLIGKGGSVIYESIAISYDGSTGITVYISNPSNVYIVGGTYSSSTLALNKWNHVAVYRSGSSWYIAINGNVQLMATSSNSVIDNSGPFIIGGNSNATSAVGVPITGRMSNLRYVVGSSVYGASNFTPPTSALTAISGTQLLTLQNSSIVDNSANALTITQVNASYPVTTTSSSSIGYVAYYATDSSGNANNWLLNNMNVTTSTDTTYDAMKDSPTNTSATVANYAVMNPLNAISTTGGNTTTLSNAMLYQQTNQVVLQAVICIYLMVKNLIMAH